MFCPQLLDRSSLTVDGHCAVFYKDSNTMVSVSCDKPQQWICQKKALSRHKPYSPTPSSVSVVTSELSEDNAKQTAEILNLTSRIQELETRENLTVRWDNLTQAFTVLESNVKNLNKLIQELETKKNNLTQQNKHGDELE
ncbi:hypothetical protein F7725_017837 [Dissostichus mawsoni]|uniref:Uncharacterized protein n=1 Tax=Dissostichus mawsoni TaxID=36200 RepID=A0A7J5XQ15_DISMA|nr:hypothetical protein F7725_017837 [Dissostichus mawsoni]